MCSAMQTLFVLLCHQITTKTVWTLPFSGVILECVAFEVIVTCALDDFYAIWNVGFLELCAIFVCHI